MNPYLTPPVDGADLRAAFVASCLRGALPPVDLRAVCLVRAMAEATIHSQQQRLRVCCGRRRCFWMRPRKNSTACHVRCVARNSLRLRENVIDSSFGGASDGKSHSSRHEGDSTKKTTVLLLLFPSKNRKLPDKGYPLFSNSTLQIISSLNGAHERFLLRDDAHHNPHQRHHHQPPFSILLD